MNYRFELLMNFVEMKNQLEEERRKSALSRMRSEALTIVFAKSRRRIDQLGVLSSKICESILKEREEIRKLQLQHCPEQQEVKESDSESEDSDEKDMKERAKLFEEDEEGGVKLYVQNTEYKQIVLNVKDLKNICEITTDAEAESEITSLDSEETKRKKILTKKLTKSEKKPEVPALTAQSQPSRRKKKKKKKKHNDSLSDDDPPVADPSPQQQRILLTEADIDTLTEDFDAVHANKLRQALGDIMRAQGLSYRLTRTETVQPAEAGNYSGGAESSEVTASDPNEVSCEAITDLDPVFDESSDALSTSTSNIAAETGLQAGPSNKKKNKKKAHADTSFDVNDVD